MSPNCLIVTANAKVYAEEISRLADPPIPVQVCSSVSRAIEVYTSETVAFGDPRMIAEILPRTPTIDWVQSSWAGVTPLVDLDRRDIQVTGVKDVFGPQMSEYVFGHLLNHELKLAQRRDAQIERQWLETHSGGLEGKRLGVMGTGSIGRHIANTGRSFGMRVGGLSRSGKAQDGFDKTFNVSELYDFLREVDYLVSTPAGDS